MAPIVARRDARAVKHLKHETSTNHQCAATTWLEIAAPGAAHTGLVSNLEFTQVWLLAQSACVKEHSGHRRWICTLVLQGEGHYRQQAIQIPAIKIDGSLADYASIRRSSPKASAMSTVKRCYS